VQQRRRPFVDPLRVVDHQDGWTFRTYAGQQAGHGGEQAGPASFVAARRVCRRSKQGQVAPQLRIALRGNRRPQRIRPAAVGPNRFRLETARRKNARAGLRRPCATKSSKRDLPMPRSPTKSRPGCAPAATMAPKSGIDVQGADHRRFHRPPRIRVRRGEVLRSRRCPPCERRHDRHSGAGQLLTA